MTTQPGSQPPIPRQFSLLGLGVAAIAATLGVLVWQGYQTRLELAKLQEDVTVLRTGPPRPAPRSAGGRGSTPSGVLQVGGAPFKGSADAAVVAFEFTDFDCPFCARFATTTLDELDKQYMSTNAVQWVFRQLPIAGLHPKAPGIAELAVCAGMQKKFWDAHKVLFQRPSEAPERSDPKLLARSLGVASGTFEACLADGRARSIVERDIAEARRLGLNSTPSFLFGLRTAEGHVEIMRSLNGALPVSDFQRILDGLLAIAKTKGL